MEKDKKRYCPDCKNGLLILTTDEDGKKVYKCELCSYTNHYIMSVDMGFLCPKCGDYLTIRKGRMGRPKFLKCHRVTCDYTQIPIKHAIAEDNKNK